jgi:hypothetical protein
MQNTLQLLKPTSVACPEYDRIHEEETANLFSTYNNTYEDFFTAIRQATGWPDININNIDNVYTAIYREVFYTFHFK